MALLLRRKAEIPRCVVVVVVVGPRTRWQLHLSTRSAGVRGTASIPWLPRKVRHECAGTDRSWRSSYMGKMAPVLKWMDRSTRFVLRTGLHAIFTCCWSLLYAVAACQRVCADEGGYFRHSLCAVHHPYLLPLLFLAGSACRRPLASRVPFCFPTVFERTPTTDQMADHHRAKHSHEADNMFCHAAGCLQACWRACRPSAREACGRAGWSSTTDGRAPPTTTRSTRSSGTSGW